MAPGPIKSSVITRCIKRVSFKYSRNMTQTSSFIPTFLDNIHSIHFVIYSSVSFRVLLNVNACRQFLWDLLIFFIMFVRATSALRLKFEVCKELRSHLELLPKTAYIQAESQFSAQLKFLPR